MAKKQKRRNKVLPDREDVRKHVLRKSRGLMVVYLFLSAMVLFTLVRSVFRREHFNVMMCLLTLALFMIPAFVEKNFKLHLSSFFEGVVLVFIFSAEILGEINCYYELVPHWDTVLHTVNGFMFAAFGFALLDMINRDSHIKFQLAPIYLALVAFCFSMTVGVIWEFYEFGMDALFSSDMQKDTYVTAFNSVMLDPAKSNTPIPVNGVSGVTVQLADGETVALPAYLDIGLIDTMKDLFVNFIGALVFSVIGFFYVKRKGRGKFAEQFIPKLCESEDRKSGLSCEESSDAVDSDETKNRP